jgi:energy-coupling factor transporter transmembrane protein EcfT
MRLHPATQILIWCVLVAVLQFLAPVHLFVAGCMALLVAFALSRHKFIQLVRRTRWILFSLWLIYAYSTPGQTLFDSAFSPTREGLLDGAVQLMRLLASLAGLAVLLDRLHRQQLIAGLYTLFAPLKWLGFSRERLAVRLALTLHYAEVAMLRTLSWQDHLQSLFDSNGDVSKVIELPVYRIGMPDVLFSSGAIALLWLVVK